MALLCVGYLLRVYQYIHLLTLTADVRRRCSLREEDQMRMKKGRTYEGGAQMCCLAKASLA
jgi:hypothetical protein